MPKAKFVGDHNNMKETDTRCQVCNKITTSHPETKTDGFVFIRKFTCHTCWLKKQEERKCQTKPQSQ